MRKYTVMYDETRPDWTSEPLKFREAERLAKNNAGIHSDSTIIFEQIGRNPPEPVAIWSRA